MGGFSSLLTYSAKIAKMRKKELFLDTILKIRKDMVWPKLMQTEMF